MFATVTSKGQVTIPVAVRRALRIRPGVRLVFRVDEDHVTVEHSAAQRHTVVEALPSFFDLAGSVSVPEELRGAEWNAIRARAMSQHTHRHDP